MNEGLADRLRGVGLATILVVEDDPIQLFLWRLWFELAGHEVVDACDGVMALERIKYRSPHVVVTDMMMPVMDGWELIRQLRADPVTAQIPIVGMSTNVRFRYVGADAFLSKPFDPNDLLEAAEALIKRTRRFVVIVPAVKADSAATVAKGFGTAWSAGFGGQYGSAFSAGSFGGLGVAGRRAERLRKWRE
jgi:CheY-like chemotaxis protein